MIKLFYRYVCVCMCNVYRYVFMPTHLPPYDCLCVCVCFVQLHGDRAQHNCHISTDLICAEMCFTDIVV